MLPALAGLVAGLAYAAVIRLSAGATLLERDAVGEREGRGRGTR
jgi:hypothetical protein